MDGFAFSHQAKHYFGGGAAKETLEKGRLWGLTSAYDDGVLSRDGRLRKGIDTR